MIQAWQTMRDAATATNLNVPRRARRAGLAWPVLGTSRGRLALAVSMVVVIQLLRVLLGPSPGSGVSLLLVLPVTLVAIERGLLVGVLAGCGAYAIFVYWAVDDQVTDVDVGGHVIRAGLYVLTGGLTGWAADRLRRAEARHRGVADALADMVSVHDRDGRYTYVSSAAVALLGYPPSELVGRSAYRLVHPHDLLTVRASHDQTLSSDAVETATYRVRRADGRYVWFETVSRPLQENGEVSEILCSSRDVTVRETQRLAVDEDHQCLRRQVQEVLDSRGIVAALQPIVRLATGEVVGYEALARFPRVHDRTPDIWFRHAAQVGLGESLELLAVEQALARLTELADSAFLTVNVSPETLCSDRLKPIIRRAPARRLVFELTEHTAIPDYTVFNAATRELREHGVRIAVDDAGAGFASLRHILDIHPEVIKLDMALTRHIHRDDGRRALARALLDFATSLGADVVAEGIESEEELDGLLELGIEFGQGYLLGAPGTGPVGAIA